ncbi:hypothetical protein HY990_05390 [Candidatus Micrarchaeota archaeon]|nr:hypothetical protein [Candidatus Micrarchaeota archaeon]
MSPEPKIVSTIHAPSAASTSSRFFRSVALLGSDISDARTDSFARSRFVRVTSLGLCAGVLASTCVFGTYLFTYRESGSTTSARPAITQGSVASVDQFPIACPSAVSGIDPSISRLIVQIRGPVNGSIPNDPSLLLSVATLNDRLRQEFNVHRRLMALDPDIGDPDSNALSSVGELPSSFGQIRASYSCLTRAMISYTASTVPIDVRYHALSVLRFVSPEDQSAQSAFTLGLNSPDDHIVAVSVSGLQYAHSPAALSFVRSHLSGSSKAVRSAIVSYLGSQGTLPDAMLLLGNIVSIRSGSADAALDSQINRTQEAIESILDRSDLDSLFRFVLETRSNASDEDYRSARSYAFGAIIRKAIELNDDSRYQDVRQRIRAELLSGEPDRDLTARINGFLSTGSVSDSTPSQDD